MSNPFTLTFGKKPLNYISRNNDTKIILDSFLSENPSEQVFIITGIRGSGKTVLLTSITKELYDNEDFIIVDLNPDKDLLEGLASELYENSKVKKLFLKKEFSFSFKGISFKLEGDTPVLTVETLIKKMLDKLKEKNKKILITIDEVTSNEHMKIFSKTFQSLVRLDYPIFLLMTGLYDNISKLQDDKSLTFLYRAPKIYLNALNLKQIKESYEKIFNIDEDTSVKLSKLTNGYAYAYQVLGYLLYKENKKDIDKELLSHFDTYLAEYVYDKLWSELSHKEQIILKNVDTNDTINIKTLLKRIDETNSYFSVYKDRLIKKGIITSPSYGTIKFSLPRFKEFLVYKDI